MSTNVSSYTTTDFLIIADGLGINIPHSTNSIILNCITDFFLYSLLMVHNVLQAHYAAYLQRSVDESAFIASLTETFTILNKDYHLTLLANFSSFSFYPKKPGRGRISLYKNCFFGRSCFYTFNLSNVPKYLVAS